MKEPVFPEGILSLNRSSGVSLAEQIYRGFREAVRKGLLSSGTRLPSTRRLATMLGVGRNTVNTAYDLLQAEGIVSIRTGAVPRIMEGLPLEGANSEKVKLVEGPGLSTRGMAMSCNLRGDGWAFRHGALQPGAPALGCFPYEDWARCLRRAARLERSPDLQYQNYTGLPSLKRQLSLHLAAERGVRAEPDQILITSSMQASLSLLSLVLADEGDVAWLEDPGYLGAKTAFHTAGMEIRPLAVDEHGANAAAMDVSDHAPKLIYVTPSHQYPLGVRMPLTRRLALLDTAGTSGATILEDDYDSEFLFSGRPVAALYGLADEGRVIYLGTFSKSLMPGLRIAYCVVPSKLIDPLTQFMRNMGCAANVQAQAALAQFMDGGSYQKHLKQIRQIYEERGALLVETLRQRLGNRVQVDIPTGNVQVTMVFREVIDDVALAKQMQEHGFAVSPLSNCYLGQNSKSGLIIGFADATPVQIAQGVETLSNLLKEAGHETANS
jgi:GntR family transcriptional regulator/MocR family aminotransferase